MKRKSLSICSLLVVAAMLISLVRASEVKAIDAHNTANKYAKTTASATSQNAGEPEVIKKVSLKVNDYVDIEFEIKKLDDMAENARAANVVILIDNSGTMQFTNNDTLTPIKEAAIALAEKVLEKSNESKISVVSFCDTANVIVSASSTLNDIRTGIEGINVVSDENNKGTNIQSGLHKAGELLKGQDNGIVIVLSDGKATRSYRGTSFDNQGNAISNNGRTVLNFGEGFNNNYRCVERYLITSFDYNDVRGYSANIMLGTGTTVGNYTITNPDKSTLNVMENCIPTISEAYLLKKDGIRIYSTYFEESGEDGKKKEYIMKNVASVKEQAFGIRQGKSQNIKEQMEKLTDAVVRSIAKGKYVNFSDTLPTYLSLDNTSSIVIIDGPNKAETPVTTYTYDATTNTVTNSFEVTKKDLKFTIKNVKLDRSAMEKAKQNSIKLLSTPGEVPAVYGFEAEMNTLATVSYMKKNGNTVTAKIENAPSLTFVADNYVPKTYTVTFWNGGVKLATVAGIEFGGVASYPNNLGKPAKESTKSNHYTTNYEFSGWKDINKEVFIESKTPVTKDMDVYAQFGETQVEDPKYTVKYMLSLPENTEGKEHFTITGYEGTPFTVTSVTLPEPEVVSGSSIDDYGTWCYSFGGWDQNLDKIPATDAEDKTTVVKGTIRKEFTKDLIVKFYTGYAVTDAALVYTAHTASGGSVSDPRSDDPNAAVPTTKTVHDSDAHKTTTYTLGEWDRSLDYIYENIDVYAYYGSPNEVEDAKYKVTFYVDNVQYGSVQEVYSGEDAKAPFDADTLPDELKTKKADHITYTYTFSGWTPAYTNITADTSVYGTLSEASRTEDTKYTVRFFSEGVLLGSEQNVYVNEAATAPSDPVKAGHEDSNYVYSYRFIGWDSDEYLNVTKNLDIHAKFEETKEEKKSQSIPTYPIYIDEGDDETKTTPTPKPEPTSSPVSEPEYEELDVDVAEVPVGAPEITEEPAIPDEAVEEEQPEENEMIDFEEDIIPQGLPETGTAPVAIFYGFGALLIALGGVVIAKRVRKEDK